MAPSHHGTETRHGMHFGIRLITFSSRGFHKQFRRNPPRDQNSTLIIKKEGEEVTASNRGQKLAVVCETVGGKDKSGVEYLVYEFNRTHPDVSIMLFGAKGGSGCLFVHLLSTKCPPFVSCHLFSQVILL